MKKNIKNMASYPYTYAEIGESLRPVYTGDFCCDFSGDF